MVFWDKSTPPPPAAAPDKMQRFPAWYDAAEGRTRALVEALKSGVPVDHADKQGMTMLSVAAYYGRVDAVACLIEKGANPNLADRHGNGPLWHATREASQNPRPGSPRYETQIVAMLLAAGADPHHPNRAGKTPPGWAQASPELQAIYRSAGYKGAFEL